MVSRRLVAGLAMALALGLAFAGFQAWTASAQGPGGNGFPPCGNYGYGPGMMGRGMMGHHMMMGGYGPENCPFAQEDAAPGNAWGSGCPFETGDWNGYGPGMMGRGMMGRGMMGQGMMGRGMMGGYGWNGYAPETTAKIETLDQAVEAAEAFVASWEDENLALVEVMQFDNHFYAQVSEVDSGRGAFELLIDPVTGAVYPEHGPNMMWNQRYGMHTNARWGMMGTWAAAPSDEAEMTVTVEQAVEAAQAYLDATYPGLTVEADHAVTFYGYYTLHIMKDGVLAGMLSVDGFEGQVWLHNWHGNFVDLVVVGGHAE